MGNWLDRTAALRPLRARALLAIAVLSVALVTLGACGEGTHGAAGVVGSDEGLRPDSGVDPKPTLADTGAQAPAPLNPPRTERVAALALDLRGFSSIEVAGPWTLQVTVGEPHTVTLEAEENILSLVDASVTAGRLRVHIDESTIRGPVSLSARITLPSLDGLQLSGAVDARVDGVVEVEQLNVVVGSRGVLRLRQVRLETLTAVVSGASRLEVAGEVDRLRLNAAGLVDVRMAGLTARAAEIGVAGEGRVNLHVTDSLSGQIAGAIHVRVTGDPPRVVVDAMGSSRVLR